MSLITVTPVERRALCYLVHGLGSDDFAGMASCRKHRRATFERLERLGLVRKVRCTRSNADDSETEVDCWDLTELGFDWALKHIENSRLALVRVARRWSRDYEHLAYQLATRSLQLLFEVAAMELDPDVTVERFWQNTHGAFASISSRGTNKSDATHKLLQWLKDSRAT